MQGSFLLFFGVFLSLNLNAQYLCPQISGKFLAPVANSACSHGYIIKSYTNNIGTTIYNVEKVYCNHVYKHIQFVHNTQQSSARWPSRETIRCLQNPEKVVIAINISNDRYEKHINLDEDNNLVEKVYVYRGQELQSISPSKVYKISN